MATRKTKTRTSKAKPRGKSNSTRQRHGLATTGKKSTAKPSPKRWSHHVMETSDAMDIEGSIFKTGNADEIADSLKRSSTRSKRRKGSPFQSAMAMLNFYINRAGRNLPKSRRSTLERAKKRLREAFGRKP
ncbi:DUF3175 domain-containing protein [Caballeronia sp. LP006]|uniref:DUF3175 domain-containing protein n=1 Tax=unclassified Caballeronia TaxID=2646786 RepID=UPI0020283E01|nr:MULTISPECIES: DUF3175 domain-containing protein [unclassified Caballeronia]MDR5828857.1 DUF3175 domain-containing protein [Caballeronia sp. LP006]